MMMSALYQTNTHSWIFIVLVHIHNIPQVNTRAPHPDSLPTGLCPYSIIMRADQKNKKTTTTSTSFMVFDWTRPVLELTIHDLPYTRRVFWPLHHRCCSDKYKILYFNNITVVMQLWNIIWMQHNKSKNTTYRSDVWICLLSPYPSMTPVVESSCTLSVYNRYWVKGDSLMIVTSGKSVS